MATRKFLLRHLGCLFLVLGAAPLAQGAEVVLGMKPEAQKARRLCWAAVSVMANRAFTNEGVLARSQADLAAYRLRDIDSLQALEIEERQALLARRNNLQTPLTRTLDKCRRNVEDCDGAREPMLLGLVSQRADSNRVLRLEDFSRDIVERRKPILIRWDYGPASRDVANRRTGITHALIVTGFNDEGTVPLLRVWDPWPVDRRARPPSSKHQKWIPYSWYVDPVNDHGQIAVHAADEFNLHREGDPNFDRIEISGGLSQALPPISLRDFPDALASAHDALKLAARSHKLYGARGQELRRRFTLGQPFPIVTISTESLINSAHEPAALLRNKTGALLVPVLSGQGELVDSFLLVNAGGEWSKAGYSNNEIAYTLVKLRRKYQDRDHPPESFFMVSIPEYVSFFAATGDGADARLMSVDHGGGEPAIARDVLPNLAREARNARADDEPSPP